MNSNRKVTVLSVLRGLGQTISNLYIYSLKHKVTEQSIKDVYADITTFLDEHETLSFSASENELIVNDDVVNRDNPLVQKVAAQLFSVKLSSFSLLKGLTLDEFRKLIIMLNANPDSDSETGDVMTLIADAGFEHIKSKRIGYQRITEDEVVVQKTKLEEMASNALGGSGDPSFAANIMAFLKGQGSLPEGEAAEAVRELASDAEQLAQMIIDSSVVKEGGADVEQGESFSDLVAGCVRRTYDSLAAGPSAKTQKGKKSMKKTLVLLEKNLLERVRQISKEGHRLGDAEAEISSTIEELKDELEIEALATEYMKKRKTAETTENKILRYIARKGADDSEGDALQEKLASFGLNADGWQQLVVRSEDFSAGNRSQGGTGEGAGDGRGVGPGDGPGAGEQGPGLGAGQGSGAGAGHGAGPGDGPGDGSLGMGLGKGDGGGTGDGGGESGGGDESPGVLPALLAQLLERFDPEAHASDGDPATGSNQEVMEAVDREVEAAVERTETQLDALEEAVREMDEEPSPGDESSEKKTLSKRQMIRILAEIVQELRQPLVVITCSIEMMRLQSAPLSEEQESLFELTESSSARLAHLVDRLVVISGMPKGRLPEQDIIEALPGEDAGWSR